MLVNGVTVETQLNVRTVAGGARRGIGRTYSTTSTGAGTVSFSLAESAGLAPTVNPDPIINGFVVRAPNAPSTLTSPTPTTSPTIGSLSPRAALPVLVRPSGG